MIGTDLANRLVVAVTGAADCAAAGIPAGRWGVDQTLSEADTADGDLAQVLMTLLRAYERLAERMHTGMGLVALRVAIAEVARIDGSTGRRQAAELIIAHSAWSNPLIDNDLRDIGAGTWHQLLEQIEDHDRWRHTTEAVVDIWMELMPTLHASAEGLAMIKRAIDDLGE
jgi:CBS-domain-containing membrane protein